MPTEIVKGTGKPGEERRRENSACRGDPFFGRVIIAVRKFPGGLGKIIGGRFRGKLEVGERGSGPRLIVARQSDNQETIAAPFVGNENIGFAEKLLVDRAGGGVFLLPESQIAEVQPRREEIGLELMRLGESFAGRVEIPLFKRNRAAEIERVSAFPRLLVALVELR